MNPSRQKPIAIVFHRFGPYHRTRVEAAAKSMNVVAVELSASSAVYAWDEIELDSAITRVTVCQDRDSRSLSTPEIDQKIASVLGEIAPIAVALAGWSDNGAIAALNWCHQHRVPAILMSESNHHDFKRRALSEWIKRCITAHFSAAIVGGKLASAYANDLGLSQDRIFRGYDVVDNDYFAANPNEGGVGTKPWEQRPLGKLANPINNSPFFLIAARLVEKKNIDRTLHAYAEYRTRAQATVGNDSSNPWDLVIAGDGPLRQTLETLARKLNLSDHVKFIGFKQYEEMPSLYHACGAFIHPSTREQWGLVVNEAMSAGCPVIVSDACGCVADLIVDGKSGILVDPHQTSSIVDAMSRIAQDRDLRKYLSQNAVCSMMQWTPSHFGVGMAESLKVALARPRRAGLLARGAFHLYRVFHARQSH